LYSFLFFFFYYFPPTLPFLLSSAIYSLS
jgi:hypothetical protein